MNLVKNPQQKSTQNAHSDCSTFFWCRVHIPHLINNVEQNSRVYIPNRLYNKITC